MKFSFGKIGIVCVSLLLVGLVSGAWAQSQNLNLASK